MREAAYLFIGTRPIAEPHAEDCPHWDGMAASESPDLVENTPDRLSAIPSSQMAGLTVTGRQQIIPLSGQLLGSMKCDLEPPYELL